MFVYRVGDKAVTRGAVAWFGYVSSEAEEDWKALDEQLEDRVGRGLVKVLGMRGRGSHELGFYSSFGGVKVSSDFKKDLARILSFKVIFEI
jgi:hypothetical protein